MTDTDLVQGKLLLRPVEHALLDGAVRAQLVYRHGLGLADPVETCTQCMGVSVLLIARACACVGACAQTRSKTEINMNIHTQTLHGEQTQKSRTYIAHTHACMHLCVQSYACLSRAETAHTAYTRARHTHTHLWALSCACLSHVGFQSESNIITVSAPVSVMPSAPARVLRRYAKTLLSGLLNSAISNFRRARLVPPSRRK